MGDAVERFIERWKDSGGSELANSQSFLKELCALLRVDAPPPTRSDDPAPAYAFERQVVFDNRDGTTSPGRIDLYKRGCFVLESKQGISTHGNEGRPLAELANERPQRRKAAAVRNTLGWDEVMLRARGQAEGYVRALPAGEGRPPFIVVVDVGHCLELYAEFSMTGGTYIHFPDPQSHRISLDDLRRPELRERLRQVWTDPLALDPSRRAAKVTREIAAHLAELAKSLEATGHRPEDSAIFLMRCLFTMFAEDVGLLPAHGFASMLADVEAEPANFKPMAEDLWKQMKTGGFWSYLRKHILHFNGYLFAEAWALDLDADQVRLLGQAAKSDWQEVEPAIFGTLLERALDPVERHKLGAHYTPRAYVERLVLPTIVEPLRKEWMNVQAAVAQHIRADAPEKALAELRTFHRRLCEVCILDPACGTGNFLYVSLEHLKRLEGEVLGMAEQVGHRQTGFELASGRTVDPHQFLGIEINPRAAAIAELVLWIGYLQWHFRTHQTNPPEPIIRDFKSIECRDAVLAWDRTEPVLDPETLQPVTRWDGRTYKKSPVTGEDIPDDSARVLVEKYINPKPAAWPASDFIIGNPPYIGNKRMRLALGDGYVEALRSAWPELPGTIDYVMYWWHLAAVRIKANDCIRFGLVTTNSISQTQNIKIIQSHMSSGSPVSIVFALPDHPWVDSSDGAAVRIAMTVGAGGNNIGILRKVINEERDGNETRKVDFITIQGKINDKLAIGVDVSSVQPLLANKNICFQGVLPVGKGFRLSKSELTDLGIVDGLLPPVVKPYYVGRDITQHLEEKYIIDFDGFSEEEAAASYPDLYHHILNRVKPERDHNKDKARRLRWWLFGRAHTDLRSAISGINRYIVTAETSKHKPFIFLHSSISPDHKLYVIATDDAFALAVLSSKIHLTWALAAGGHLGYGNDPTWTNTTCFLPFPFPATNSTQQVGIRNLGERLDAHRKRQQALHPDLTMTGMYNVLEKLRAGLPLTETERAIHEKGLVGMLKQIHDELDSAVFAAYGWSPTLSDEEILEHLVALNKERAAEEAQGIIRWLRPEYQAPTKQAPVQGALAGMAQPVPAAKAPSGKQPWPTALPDQAQAVRQALETLAGPADVATVAKLFTRAPRARVAELLETLVGLGQARVLEKERYAV